MINILKRVAWAAEQHLVPPNEEFQKGCRDGENKKGRAYSKKNKVVSNNFSWEREVGGCEICMRKRKKVREITHKYTVWGKGDGLGFCERWREGGGRWQEPWWVELDWLKRSWGFAVILEHRWRQRDAQLNLKAPPGSTLRGAFRDPSS